MRVLFIALAIALTGAALVWLGGTVSAQPAPATAAPSVVQQARLLDLRIRYTKQVADARFAQIANQVAKDRKAAR